MVFYCMWGYAYILHELFPILQMKKLTFFDLKLPAQAHTSCQWSKFRYFWLKAHAFSTGLTLCNGSYKGLLRADFYLQKRRNYILCKWSCNTHAAFCLKASSPLFCQSLPSNPCLRLQSRELQANIYSWNEPFSPISNPSKTALASSQTFEKQFASGLKKSRKK